jgi:hypothetical protein
MRVRALDIFVVYNLIFVSLRLGVGFQADKGVVSIGSVLYNHMYQDTFISSMAGIYMLIFALFFGKTKLVVSPYLRNPMIAGNDMRLCYGFHQAIRPSSLLSSGHGKSLLSSLQTPLSRATLPCSRRRLFFSRYISGTSIPTKTWVNHLPAKFQPYVYLARVDKPIGSLLLFYPCGWWRSRPSTSDSECFT